MTQRDLPAHGRLLGLDAGERRVGVAISDPEQRLALPLRVIERRGGELGELEEIGRGEEIVGIVVGLPLSLSGEAGAQAELAGAFARAVGNRLNLPVAFWDERLSSQEAERMLGPERARSERRGPGRRHARGAQGRPERGSTDVVAATIILQAFLDSRRGRLEH